MEGPIRSLHLEKKKKHCAKNTPLPPMEGSERGGASVMGNNTNVVCLLVTYGGGWNCTKANT